MSQYTPLEFTIPDNINYPEFSSRNETDKILKLVSSGVLRTHSDTFNSLDASYLNNLPGPRVEISQTFEEMYNKFLTDTTISPNINIPNEVITNWESDILERFANHLNKNKMYLIDEILPKIPTMIPEIIKEDEPIKYNTSWTETKKRHYDNYIKKQIGSYTLENITPSMINECIELQALQGLKPRTIKTTLEILRPIFDEALDDKAIQSNPCNAKTVIDNKNIKRQKTKKIVNTPIETLQVFFTAIEELYRFEPFYKSLYLFGIAQRRKSEILKLRWEDIDFNSNTYLCRDTKNGENQTFYLPPSIKNELLQFREIKGWVYGSPLDNSKHITNIEKQTTKVKEKVEAIYKKMIIENGVTNEEHIKLELAKKPKFTLHYFRNIGSSVLQQQGMESIISGALGHNNMNTKNLYTTIDYITSSKKYNEVIEANLILINK